MNIFFNIENHIRNIYYLEKGGDIWRKPTANTLVQILSFVDGNYKRIILFH